MSEEILPMYVQVASYKLGTKTADELVPKIEAGNLPVMKEVPGFVEYYALRLADNEVASVAVFRDRSGVEEAEDRLAEWIEQTVDEFQITPGEVIEGEVLVTTRSEQAMSQENVEIVRRLYEAVGRDDSETVLALYDPHVEFDFSRSPLGNFMERGIYHGYDGIRTWNRERYEAWESIEETCGELIGHGEHVISTVTSRGRGRSSGADVAWTHYGVWTFREGKIVRVAWFPTREDALEAAGLSE